MGDAACCLACVFFMDELCAVFSGFGIDSRISVINMFSYPENLCPIFSHLFMQNCRLHLSVQDVEQHVITTHQLH